MWPSLPNRGSLGLAVSCAIPQQDVQRSRTHSQYMPAQGMGVSTAENAVAPPCNGVATSVLYKVLTRRIFEKSLISLSPLTPVFCGLPRPRSAGDRCAITNTTILRNGYTFNNPASKTRRCSGGTTMIERARWMERFNLVQINEVTIRYQRYPWRHTGYLQRSVGWNKSAYVPDNAVIRDPACHTSGGAAPTNIPMEARIAPTTRPRNVEFLCV